MDTSSTETQQAQLARGPESGKEARVRRQMCNISPTGPILPPTASNTSDEPGGTSGGMPTVFSNYHVTVSAPTSDGSRPVSMLRTRHCRDDLQAKVQRQWLRNGLLRNTTFVLSIAGRLQGRG